MGLVDQQVGAGLALHVRDFLQRGGVAQHGVDALDHDQLVAGHAFEASQALVEVVGIVVAEADHLGVAEARAVIDAGVAVGVQHQVVAAAHQGRQDAQVGLVAGGEHHGVFTAVEFRQVALQAQVAVVTAVGDAGPGGARALALGRLHRLFDAVGIEGQAQVVVGAQKDGALAAQHALGGRQDTVEAHAQRLDAHAAHSVISGLVHPVFG